MQVNPTRLTVPRLTIDAKALKKTFAQPTDFARLVSESTIVVDKSSGKVMIVYLASIAEDTTELVAALRTLRIGEQDRTDRDIKGQTRTFGYVPRHAQRHDFCSSSTLAREAPDANLLLAHFAGIVAREYRRYEPEMYAAHQQEASNILPDYVLEDGPFTAGVVNRNFQLPYHYDAGNLKDVWSNMLGFRAGIRGGHLSVPEYDVGFAIGDKSLLMFDGQGLLHGVTPIREMQPDHYRFTVVYYTRATMWQCLPPDEEIADFQQRRAAREEARLETLD